MNVKQFNRGVGRSAGHILLLAAFVVSAWVTFAPGSAYASEPDPPIKLLDVQGMQCLLTTSATDATACDMLLLLRYELPKEDWRADDSGVGKFMQEIACVDGDENNILDLCYTSLVTGMVSASMYSGPHATAILENTRPLQRIDHALSALYFPASSSLTFGNTSYEVCLEPSVTIFAPATQICRSVTWNASTSFANAQTVNAEVIKTMGADLGAALPGLSRNITANGRIASVGSIYFSESFSGLTVAAPDAFTVSTQTLTDFAGSSVSPAESTIATEAQASNLWGWVDDFNNNHMGGGSLKLVAGAMVGAISVIIFMFVFGWIKNIFIAAVAGVLFLMAGVFQDFVDVNIFMALALLIFGVGAFQWISRRFN